jgi:hypothetical protein
MKSILHIKIVTIIILIIASVQAGAQHSLYFQGFEGNVCENWNYSGGVTTAGVQRSGNHSGRVGYLSNSLQFSPANVSGYDGLVLTIYHSVKPGPGPGMDTREGALIQLSINGGPFTTIGSTGGFSDASWPFNSSSGGSLSGSAGCSIYTSPNPILYNIPNGTNTVQIKVISVRAGSCGAFNNAMSNATASLYDRSDEGFYIDDVEITTTTPLPPITLISAPGTDSQYLNSCIPVPLIDIEYAAGLGAVNVTGLPPGVSYTYAGGIVTISGSPASDGVYQYNIINTCTDSSASGTITKTTPQPITQAAALTGCNSVLFNGNIYTASIVLNDTLRSYQGCDSVYNITDIVVTQVNPVIQALTLTGCNSVLFDGTTYTASIVLNDTLRSQQGCDSAYNITNIIVTAVNPVTQTLTLTGCNSVVFDGTTYTASIVLNDTLRSYQGCDSVYNITNIIVTAVNPVTQTLTLTGCNSVLFDATTYTASIVLNDTLRSHQGCDSVYNITNIIITPVNPVTQTVTLAGCNSVLFNGTTYTVSVVLNDTLRSYQGCDSVYNITNIIVTAVNPVTQTVNISGCNSVLFDGTTYMASIVLNDTLRSHQGCDSVYKITNIIVTAVNPVTQTVTLTGCNSVLFDGTTYTASIVLNDTLRSYQGCDSVYNITDIVVTQVNPVTQTVTLAGCNSVLFNGTTYTTSIVLNDTLRSHQGCDSVYNITKLVVTAVNQVTQTVTLTGCNSVLFNGTTYTASIVLNDTLRSYQGCDSIYNITSIIITPVNPVTHTVTLTGCNSVFFNGIDYSTSTVLRDTVKNIQGCDSVYKTTNILITPIVPLTYVNSLTGCNRITHNGTDYSNSVMLRDTVLSYQGCDSVYNVTNIVVTTLTPRSLDTTLNGCDSVVFNNTRYTSSTELTDTLKSRGGCDSIYRKIKIMVTNNDFILSLTSSANQINPGQLIILTTSSASGYSVLSWEPYHAFPLQQQRVQNIFSDTTIQITVTAKSISGCTAKANLLLSVNQLSDDIYFPSAFNPGSTAGNRSFGPLGRLSLIKNYSLLVYNRWGQVVYSSSDPFQKWDGMQKGALLNPGNFVWQASYLYKGISKRVQKGNVLLIK